jgi:hypothetical protein
MPSILYCKPVKYVICVDPNSRVLNGKGEVCVLYTGARWPNFRQNNPKEAPKNCPLPEKIGGRKIAEFGKKWQKRGRKIFLQIFR